MAAESAPEEGVSTWRDLFAGGRGPAFGLVCFGVWLNAVDTLVMATVMPSVARDVGGYAYFAWATAGYLLGSILAGAVAGSLAERIGLRRGLAVCGAIYAVGCLISALAPSIAPFLIGRLVQGVGAGFIVGLCYVAVRAAFPERSWSQVFAALSAVWGAATVLGPLLGGLFAQAHIWRALFWAFAAQAVVFAAAAAFGPRTAADPQAREAGAPLVQLLLLAGAVSLVATAGVFTQPTMAAAVTAAGLVLLLLALRADARAVVRLFPASAADLKTAAGQGYAVVLCLSAAAIGFSVYGSAILQTRLHLSPLVAGYVVVSESLGWTVTAVLVPYAPRRLRGLLIRLGACAVAMGLAGCAATISSAGVWVISAFGLLMGGGFGLCWSFVAQRILNGLPASEGAVGSGAIPMTQILGNAIGSAAAGVIANLLGFRDGFSAEVAVRAGPLLLGPFVPVALIGVAAAWRLGGARERIDGAPREDRSRRTDARSPPNPLGG